MRSRTSARRSAIASINSTKTAPLLNGSASAASGAAVVQGQHGQSLPRWRFSFPQIDAVSEIPATCGFSRRAQPALRDDEIDDPLGPVAGLQIGEDEGPLAAHSPRVALHDIE